MGLTPTDRRRLNPPRGDDWDDWETRAGELGLGSVHGLDASGLADYVLTDEEWDAEMQRYRDQLARKRQPGFAAQWDEP